MTKSTAPIFIIGAPRSGTTLIYQVLTTVLDVGYINNFIARFWKHPVLGVYLSERVLRLKTPTGDYTSHLGRTKGWSGVHEFGYFWDRFMPIYNQEHHYVRHIRCKYSRTLHTEVMGMSRAFHNKPMVFKNLTCGMRIKPLCHTFPDAKFLVVHRDKDEMVKSILRCRLEVSRNYRKWFSLMPEDTAQIKKITNSRKQVEAQVDSIYHCIDHSTSPPDAIDIDYEDFVIRPFGHMAQISHAWGIPFRQTFKLKLSDIKQVGKGCCK